MGEGSEFEEPVNLRSLNKKMSQLKKLIKDLVIKMEKGSLAQQVELLRQPWRMVYLNFLAGLARGFGIAVGLTLLGAVFLSVLYRMADLNLPLIGKYIADLVKIVQENL